MCIALRVWCCFLHHFLHARLMVDTICVASKITKGDYGCKFAEVSDISALLWQNMGLHSIGVISNLSTAVCIMHACAVAPLFLYQKIVVWLLLKWDVADLWRRLGQAQYRNWRLLQMQHQSITT